METTRLVCRDCDEIFEATSMFVELADIVVCPACGSSEIEIVPAAAGPSGEKAA